MSRAGSFPFVSVAYPLAKGSAQFCRFFGSNPDYRIFTRYVRKLKLIDTRSGALRGTVFWVVERHHIALATDSCVGFASVVYIGLA